MSIQVVHIFYDVFMGWSHASLREVMHESVGKARLERRELAVFINKGWTACKILAADDVLLYYRDTGTISFETIKELPMSFGGTALVFTKGLETHVTNVLKGKFKLKDKMKAAA